MKIVTFGEVMLRLAPPEFFRLRQNLPGSLDATFGGGEVNVAVSVALQGGQSSFLTVLPDNPLTDAFTQELRKLGVGDELVVRSKRGRFGIYFVETGANQRGGTVTYDRDGSSIAITPPEEYDWDTAFKDATWLHITGITPALSEPAAKAARLALEKARGRGLKISCDLNFRKKLWRWHSEKPPVELARETMRGLMPFLDYVIANEEDADLSLGIRAEETDVDSGELNVAAYEKVAQQIVSEFPNVQGVAITLRESLSASHNNWGAMYYDAGSQQSHFAPTKEDGVYAPYEMRNIVDRVGAGDSFAGGLIFALNTPELSSFPTALQYAVAASCLKHSIKGDFNYVTRPEIEALMKGSGSGRVQR
ncbi:MAG: sugar kinase [Planctomycetaceae bacterium]|nr:sugar kinase [Planctomycetaceae bacterium]